MRDLQTDQTQTQTLEETTRIMDTILAAGATGECVVKLVTLARAAGIPVPRYSADEPLTASDLTLILNAVNPAPSAPAAETVLEPPITQAVKGLLFTQVYWDELSRRAQVAAARIIELAAPTADPTGTAAQTSGATDTNASPSAATGAPAAGTEASPSPASDTQDTAPLPPGQQSAGMDTPQEGPAPGHWA